MLPAGYGRGSPACPSRSGHVQHREEPDDGLREAMSLLSATLESTADGILVVGTDGQIAGVNEQFVSDVGHPARAAGHARR